MSAARPLKFKVQFTIPGDRSKVNFAALPREASNRIHRGGCELWYATRIGAYNAAMKARKGGFSTHVTEYELVEANPGGDI